MIEIIQQSFKAEIRVFDEACVFNTHSAKFSPKRSSPSSSSSSGTSSASGTASRSSRLSSVSENGAGGEEGGSEDDSSPLRLEPVGMGVSDDPPEGEPDLRRFVMRRDED